MQSIEKDIVDLLDEMRTKQKSDLRDYIEGLETILPQRLPQNPKIISLKKKEQNLASLGRYTNSFIIQGLLRLRRLSRRLRKRRRN